jgi:hypothetical protein
LKPNYITCITLNKLQIPKGGFKSIEGISLRLGHWLID